MDERVLAERLITYDTSNVEGLRACAGFIKGWLEARDIAVEDHQYGEVFALTAEVGPEDGPTLVFHGHYDVVPARPEQFTPRIQGDRLEGRGAYDMKGGLAAMMCALQDLRDQTDVRVRFVCVPDEESEEIDQRTSDLLVKAGYVGDFAITGEPTDLHVGVQAKGVLALRIMVFGTSAHGSTPWLGDNAVLKAIDVFRRIESMPFTLESSELFDRPSVNLGRIIGGDAPNKVPEECAMDVDIRYLPEQDPGELLAQIRSLPDVHVARSFIWPPARVSPHEPVRARALPGGLAADRRRVDERRPRRRLRRGGVPEGGRAGGRVRPVRRRPSRARRVGLDRLAGPLPPRAGGLRAQRARALRRLTDRFARRGGRPGVKSRRIARRSPGGACSSARCSPAC